MEAIPLKRISLICAVALSSALLWATAKPWLESPMRFASYTVIIWPSIALILSSAITAITWMLLERPIERVSAIVASWASFILFWSPDLWYISMLPLFAGLWYLASQRIRSDMSDRHSLRVSTSLGAGLTPLMLGTFLMISLGFYLLPSNHTVGVKEVSVGVQGYLKDAYTNPVLAAQLNQLPASMRAQVKSDIAKNVEMYIQKYLGPLGSFLPPLLAFGLFLVLWSVLFIYREGAIWCGVGIFAILKAVGFLKVATRSVQAEVIEL